MTDYPKEIANVQEGLAALSQRDCLVALDELMSRRGHNHRDLIHMIAHLRRERAAWGDARDQRELKKEEEDV